MIEKCKFDIKSVNIFFSRRCAFLLCLFLVTFVKAQIFVAEGATVFDNENTITEVLSNEESNINKEPAKVKSDIPKPSSPKKEHPKTFVTKKEIVEKKIEKQAILNKSKKTESFFFPIGKGNSTFISSGTADSKSAVVNQNHNQLADISTLKFIVLHHTISRIQLQNLLTFIYKNSVEYFYSVRPPPSFSYFFVDDIRRFCYCLKRKLN